MKLILTLLLIPTISFAAKIPMDTFDQAKLETLLRNIPASLARTENREGFVRKHYVFPKDKKADFTITCQADYFGEATVPSYKACELESSNKDFVGDESLIKITDPTLVSSLRAAISYGDDVKKFYSFERVYGQANDGVFRNLFRYSFICTAQSCDVTFTTKEALEY